VIALPLDYTNIQDPDDIFKDFEDTLRGRIRVVEHNMTTYNGDTATQGDLRRTKNALLQMQENLKLIKRSNTRYILHYSPKIVAGRGNTSYNYSSLEGRVELVYGKGSEVGQEVIAHEIQHAIQYEQGKLSFSIKDTSSECILYRVTLSDISDETEAYKYAVLFKGNIADFDTLTDKGTRIKYKPTYDTLPDKRAGLNDNIGAILQERTIRVGINNVPVREFYKGWQKDFLNGCDQRPDKGDSIGSPCYIVRNWR
jgi:hypothetical protein